MKCISVIAKNLASATAYAEGQGWTSVSLSSWKDEAGRLATYVTGADAVHETRAELAIATTDAFEREDYSAILANFANKNVPIKYL